MPVVVRVPDEEAETVRVGVNEAVGVRDLVPVADSDVDSVVVAEGDGESDGVTVSVAESVAEWEDVTEIDAVKLTVGLRVLVAVTVAVQDGVWEYVSVLVTEAVGEREPVVDVVGVPEGERLIVGVTLMVGVTLTLAGASTSTVSPVPSCAYVLSPQQEIAPAVVSAHVC